MKNLLLVLCLVVFCLQAEAALPATDQNLEAAIAYGKSYQGEKNDAVMLQPWVIAESFETNPYRDEERIIVYTPYLLTALDTAGKTQEAAGIRAVGEAEASAIQAKGIAEAEAMEKKAEAYAKYNKAAVAEMMIKVLPDIAAKVAEPLGQIDKITIIGGGDGENGVGKVAGNVPVVMAKVFESMKEATGIDLSEIINADSYDAKVNRNVNVTGLDGVNLVVNADTDKNGEKTEN